MAAFSAAACAALPNCCPMLAAPAVATRPSFCLSWCTSPGSAGLQWQGAESCSRLWRRRGRRGVVCVAAVSDSGSCCIEFIRGIKEQTIPDVKLTRSRDGTSGVATFVFDQPSVFDSSRELGEITGIYMVDEEGVVSSVDVSAKFINGKPAKIEARYVMRNVREWDRFMRFMERYANENNLGFVKS